MSTEFLNPITMMLIGHSMENNDRYEIGSEFSWSTAYATDQAQLRFENGVRTYSGRMALYGAIQDCIARRSIRHAWLPSYCCASMVQPFLLSNIPVSFYRVEFDDVNHGFVREPIQSGKDDLVLSMSYFGFFDEGHRRLLEQCRLQGTATIEDRTHSLLMTDERDSLADYSVASLRKWFPLASGGWIVKTTVNLEQSFLEADDEIIRRRKEAMKQKAAYLRGEGDIVLKQTYSQAYQACNKSFESILPLRSMDEWSASFLCHQDLEAIRNQRRRNAQVLLEGLQAMNKVVPVYAALKGQDCPLFVPVLTSEAKQLQGYLAQKNIYCPMHWPRPCPEAESGFYGTEVSLICDQRYNERDMLHIVDILKQYDEEK